MAELHVFFNHKKNLDWENVIGFIWIACHVKDEYFFSSPLSYKLPKGNTDEVKLLSLIELSKTI